jgi:hypothetical protein
MMDCSQFRELLADLDGPGVLSAERREEAFAHAEVCGDCGPLLTEMESLDSELRRLVAAHGNSQASGRVEAHLLGAFRERKAAGARERMWRFAAVIGIAAMMLLSLGAWLYQRSNREAGTTVVNTANGGHAVLPKTQARNTRPITVAPSRPALTTMPDKAVKEDGAAVNEPVQAVSEEGRAFIRLPDAEDPAELDDGAVVRVVMPRADLASFGLPVEAMEGGGTVRADLIVSADGTPQAIRLISQDEENEAAQR